ncbi:hypothetical protein AM587_10017503 [Phytophthora nicotianae]|uniref:Uncharacterized protein n=1 Tax=Phytophthora nicotianae TaxID=4792 RepID=A0A0W8C8M7_PHYNI|nr:hypothetical protein AM587_10017503 [Phytophthora nicotianae]
MNALLGELRMVKVLHQQSGVCLFTHQWKWNPHAHAEGVDALVMSFTQFAREIDGGEVVQVHFDPSKTDKKDRSGSSPMPAFLQRILERFSEVFEHELELLQPQLQTSATPTAEEREAVEAPFRRFENELDNPLLLQSSGDYGLQ